MVFLKSVLLVLSIAVVISGWSRKNVYGFPENNAPPPAPSFYPAPEPAVPPVQQAPSVMEPPEVRDREMEAPTPPAVQEQAEPQRGPAAARKQPKKLKKEEAAKSPQRQASMQQVNQARGQLERGRPDTAIRTLEKAVRIDAGNGEAFVLLARAWKQKGERRKALEFAKKAALLCRRDRAKLREVFLLESDLYRELGDTADAAESSRKASALYRRGARGPAKRGE